MVAFVNAFVLARFRDRLSSKLDLLLESLPHDLPFWLDSRRFIIIPHSLHPPDLIEPFLSNENGVYFGTCPDLSTGTCPMRTAFAAVLDHGEAIASLHAGELAFYKSEDLDVFVLASRPDTLSYLRENMDRCLEGKPPSNRRPRRGSR
mgnify:CR=1 FL=1